MIRLRIVGTLALVVIGLAVVAGRYVFAADKKATGEIEVAGYVENFFHTCEGGTPSYTFFELRGDDRVFKVGYSALGIQSQLLGPGMPVEFKCKAEAELDRCHTVITLKRTRTSASGLAKDVDASSVETKAASRNGNGTR